MAEALEKSRWRCDPSQWPGPDRRREWVHDLVHESPSGRLAAVVYSIMEVRMNWYYGMLIILQGDRASPRRYFQARDFDCTGKDDSVRWLGGDRYVSVQTTVYDRKSKRHDIPFCLLDLESRSYTFVPFENPCATIEAEAGKWVVREWQRADAFRPRDGEIVTPQRLRWLPWDDIDRRQEHYFGGVFGTA
jgi:hypothetical protein